ncbi:SAVMC3_10250 family protein [Streptomyces sp. NBC_00414]|uniref:SAVMC3_10250 family protein n=1 Tax=Streptomyces sp. NBC_00414 TaxID=2975739 RepID=UPI002E236FFA
MRDLLYLSRDKLKGLHIPPRRFPFLRREVEITALGTGFHLGPDLELDTETQAGQMLAVAAKAIRRKAKASGDPSLLGGEWFYFDQELEYGSVVPGISGASNNWGCAFFFAPSATDSSDGGLILCGTGSNLTDRAGEQGEVRYSALTGLMHFLTQLDPEREHPTPSLRSCRVSHTAAIYLQQLQRASETKVEAVHFTRARLSGMARALSVCNEECGMKLLLGTPLYVEFGPWNSKW